MIPPGCVGADPVGSFIILRQTDIDGAVKDRNGIAATIAIIIHRGGREMKLRSLGKV
jgi:hypothetical protein